MKFGFVMDDARMLIEHLSWREAKKDDDEYSHMKDYLPGIVVSVDYDFSQNEILFVIPYDRRRRVGCYTHFNDCGGWISGDLNREHLVCSLLSIPARKRKTLDKFQSEIAPLR